MDILISVMPNVEDVLFSQRVTIGSHNLRMGTVLPSVYIQARQTLMARQVLGLSEAPKPPPLARLKKDSLSTGPRPPRALC